MIQIKDNPQRILADICQAHFAGVRKSLVRAIRTNITDDRQAYLLNDLELIVTGRPEHLLRFSKRYKAFCTRQGLAWDADLEPAFSYNNFIVRRSYNAYHLAHNLKVNVCPYCNRQYTFTIINDRGKITRPEFDHFFSQADYPMFALSFYNLVPSCHICNSNLKGTKKLKLHTHIHPYVGCFEGDARFNYLPLDPLAHEGLSTNYEIKLSLNETAVRLAHIRGNMDVFKLEEIYKEHADLVQDIVRKFHISGGDYLRRLQGMFSTHIGTDEMDQLFRLAFQSFYAEDDHEKRPFSKFIRDIFEDSNFIKP